MKPYTRKYIMNKTVLRTPLPSIDKIPEAFEVEYIDILTTPPSSISMILESTASKIKDKIKETDIHGWNNRKIMLEFASDLVPLIFPNLLAHHLVGVQPINGPLGLVHQLRVRHEQISPKVLNEMYKGVAEPTSIFHMSLTIEKMVAEAKLIKHTTRYGIDTVYLADLNNTRDAKEVLLEIIAQELVSELDMHLINTLYSLCPTGRFPSNAEIITFDNGGRFAKLGFDIRRAANFVAAKTRRGFANWCILNDDAYAVIRNSREFEPLDTIDIKRFALTAQVGTLNCTKIYHNPALSPVQSVLVGYKGPGNISDNIIGPKGMCSDSGVIFAPYVLAEPELMIDPMTFEPVVRFQTMASYVMAQARDGLLGDASDYYQSVTFDPTTI